MQTDNSIYIEPENFKGSTGKWELQEPSTFANRNRVNVNNETIFVIEDYSYIGENPLIRDSNAALLSQSKELLKALQGLVNDVENKPNDTRYATHLKIAKEVINKALNQQ